MVRVGLGPEWSCLFANDIDLKKGRELRPELGRFGFSSGGCCRTDHGDPARDRRSGVGFVPLSGPLARRLRCRPSRRAIRHLLVVSGNLMKSLGNENRVPSIIVLENVCGALTSHGGKDFTTISAAIVEAGYRFGALVIDAVHFVPQSRPRLFVIAVDENRPIPEGLTSIEPGEKWRTRTLIEAHDRLSERVRENWVWWRLPPPPRRYTVFADLLEESPKGVKWASPAETRKLLDMMSPVNLAKVVAAKKTGRRMVGTIYKRTRLDRNGARTQRAEIRFDGIAGCLRTPLGGSSRQTIMIVEGDEVCSRLLSPREAGRG